MDGRLLFGILVVSIVAFFIGKIFFKLIGNERGCIGCIVWGCLLMASILSGNIVIIIGYVVISFVIYAR